MADASSSSSLQVTSGRVRDSSIAAGVSCSPSRTVFLRLAGDSDCVALEDLFLVTRLAALMICFDRFSSTKMA